LVQICLGVSLTIVGSLTTTTYGLVTLFAGILTTASRSVFYKMSFDNDNTDTSIDSYSIYLNTNFVSFMLFLPFYLVKLISQGSNASLWWSDFDTSKFLFVGTLFNFLYNLVSVLVLTNLTTLTHSIINVAKRMFVVFSSTVFFAAYLTQLQLIGLVMADSGLLAYTYIRIRSRVESYTVSRETRKLIKRIVIVLTCLICIAAFISETTLHPSIGQENKFVNYNNDKSNANTTKLFEADKRLVCIEKIQQRLLETYSKIIPKEKEVILVQVPMHQNYGDTMIW
jgi:hypothetical protein